MFFREYSNTRQNFIQVFRVLRIVFWVFRNQEGVMTIDPVSYPEVMKTLKILKTLKTILKTLKLQNTLKTPNRNPENPEYPRFSGFSGEVFRVFWGFKVFRISIQGFQGILDRYSGFSGFSIFLWYYGQVFRVFQVFRIFVHRCPGSGCHSRNNWMQTITTQFSSLHSENVFQDQCQILGTYSQFLWYAKLKEKYNNIINGN